MSELPSALSALAALGIHPLGVTVDGSVVALRLSSADQAALLTDDLRRERIVGILKAHGFLHVTLQLDPEEVPGWDGSSPPH